MARTAYEHSETRLIATILAPLAEAEAFLRPALDERNLVIVIRRAGISLAKKTVSPREVERLLAKAWIRREPPPSDHLRITLAGELAVTRLRASTCEIGAAAYDHDVDPATGDFRTINRRESALMWLAHRKDADGKPLIDALQLAAGERFRNDFTLAGLSPRMTLDWTRFGAGATSGVGHPGLATDMMVSARQRLHAALDALGPAFAGLTLDLCCFLKGLGDVERERGWPQRSARKHFSAALTRLVAHYGLGAVGPDRARGITMWADV